MKRNRSNSFKVFLVAVLFPLLLICSCHQGKTAPEPEDVLVFEGTLEKLEPDPGMTSGGVAVYRLAKYRVERICKGKYDANEIVVDHLVFDGKEFDGVSLGDRVCVSTRIFNKILVRYDSEGIRNPSDDVKTFYEAADKITRVDQAAQCCTNP